MSRILEPRFYLPGEKLYIAAVIYLLAAVPLDAYTRITGTTGSVEEGNLLQQLIWMGAYGIAMLPLAALMRNTLWLWKKNILLVTLVIMACFSAFWSADPYTTLRRSVACLGTFMLGSYMAVRFTPAEMVRLVAAGLGLAALSSFVLAGFMPQQAIVESGVHEGRWRGVYTHKNELGRYMVLGLMTSIMAYSLSSGLLQRAYLAGAVLCAGLLLLSQSATALVAAIMTGLVWFMVNRIRRSAHAGRHMAVALAVAIVTSSILMAAFFLMENQLLLSLLGRSSDLTQRVPLWNGAMAGISDHPWLGFGYEVFWDRSRGLAYSYISGFLNWDAPHAHNGILQLGTNLGLIGIGIFLYHFVQVSGRTVRLLGHTTEPPADFALIILIITVLINMMEVTIMRDNNLLWLAYIYVALRSSYSMELQAEGRHAASITMTMTKPV